MGLNRAKYKAGDSVSTNDLYRREGIRYFGKDLKHKNYKGSVLRVYENTKGDRDGMGDVWEHFYLCSGDVLICERFLSRSAGLGVAV